MDSNKPEKLPSPYWPTLGGPILLFLLALFFFARPLLLLGDGGSCRHYLTGLYLLQNHGLPTTTYMSAIEPSAPWSTHELLCDLIFGLPFPAFGLNWVVLSSALAIALGFTWAYQMARLRGCSLLISLLSLILAIEACTVHWSARPHLFTYLLFLATYYECFVSVRSIRKRTVILSVLMFIWGNLHGSFPLGMIMIACRAVGDFFHGLLPAGSADQQTNLPAEELDSDTRAYVDWNWKQSALMLACGLLAACLNIRGANFLGYIFGYLTSSKIQANSDEWRSIDFQFAAPVFSFLFLFSMLSVGWVYARIKPKFGEYLYMLFLFCVSLYAMRLIPYFALAALPAMAPQWAELSQRPKLLSTPFIGKLLAADNRASQSEWQLGKLGLVFTGLATALCVIFLAVGSFKIADFDPTRLPSRAVNYMREHNIKGLGFTKDNWGAYLYWRTNEPIFIDDKTDFYSQKLLDDYTTIFVSSPGWKEKLAAYPFSYILIPRGLPLEFLLKDSSDWKAAYEDEMSVLFLKAK